MNTPKVMSRQSLVPFEDVAADAVDLIRTFRENGSVGFHDLPLVDSRAAYELGCATNGLPVEKLDRVEDFLCPVDGGSIMLRHYIPRDTGPQTARPVILFLHGGGWVMGSLETHDRICRRLATVSGLDIVSVDYRLAPEYPFPVPLEDCVAALKFIAERAKERGWDPARVIVAGDSAGGNLATVIATAPECQVDGISIIGQLLLYPVVNLHQETESYLRIASGFPMTANSMRWFRKQYLNDAADDDVRVSPGLRNTTELAGRPVPPAFVITVGLDPLADEGIAYAALLARAGTYVEHHHLPRHAHGLFTSAGQIPTGARMLNRAGTWLAELARPSSGAR